MMTSCHKVMRKIILQYPRFQNVVLSCRFLLGWDSSQLPLKYRLKLALAIINVASKFDLPKNCSPQLTLSYINDSPKVCNIVTYKTHTRLVQYYVFPSQDFIMRLVHFFFNKILYQAYVPREP